MFSGLVATASSRSSSRGSASSTSSVSSDKHSAPRKASAAGGGEPSFHSPCHTSVSSPRTVGGHEGLASSEFLSPFSVGGYPTPSTGIQHRRPYTTLSDHSPSVRRSWGTTSAEAEGNEGGGALIREYSTDVSPSSRRFHGGALHAEEVEDEHVSAQGGDSEGRRASLSPLSSSRSSSSSHENTGLERLARQQSSSSASDVFATTSRGGDSPHGQRERQERLSPHRDAPLAPQPVLASKPLSLLTPKELNAAAPDGSQRPITTPSAPLSPRAPESLGTDSGARVHLGLGARSDTHEGKVLSSSTRSSSSASAAPSRASNSCAPPPDSPPDSAIKRPPDTAMMAEPIEDPSPKAADGDAHAFQVAATVKSPGDGTTLLFSVQYTEEEHRVQLEMQETEERRCVFRAHKAVLALWRMWAAAEERAGQPEKYLDINDGETIEGIEGHPSTTRLLAGRTDAHRPASFQNTAVDSLNSSGASATERVHHFLNTSIESARERRNVGDRAAIAEVAASIHHSATPTIAYHGNYVGEQPALFHQGPPLPSSAPTPALSSSAVTSSSPPQTSRFLDYSSMLGPDARASATAPFLNSTGLPRRQLEQPRPYRQQRARLFSPWRVDRSEGRTSPLRESAAGEGGEVHQSHFARRGSGGSRFSSPLIPRIRRTSPLGFRSSTATTPPRSKRSFTPDYKGVSGMWRHTHTSHTPNALSSSALSEAFLSLSSRHAGADDQGRTSSENALSSSAVPMSNALVRSPRVTLASTSPLTSTRRRTPPWNTSPNLCSTSAASRCGSATAERHGEPSTQSLGFVPNKAFRQRQRAACLNSVSTVPLDEAVVPPSPTTSSARIRDESRRREQLSSYVQYKRFFDAVYGAGPSFPVPAAQQQQRRHRPLPSCFTPGVEGEEKCHAVAREMPLASRHWALRHADGGCQTVSASLSLQRSANLSHCPTWAPDMYSRHAVLHPKDVYSRSPAGLPDSVGRPSASLTPLGEFAAVVPERVSSLYSDLCAARISRLCTLERICRAELQRRWMEDQNLLLHRFVIEGTATLQRAQAAAEAWSVSSAVAAASRAQPRGRRSVRDTVDNALAWTFIPNEIE
ncbi:hypothetical protein ABL78_1665 [Leptomonas seymouri]|uniref:Uncharacterized protein n=1 Tax=Leptomonas seymouri TaxID=5684 RepID=A0A0N1IM90_LEPSE|nr:hypothetical protein ABL78_1665 [Leptomonas seymouri]|eukprot:KPI89242.1 hypothetical protein ABL78_1665 [Leptomonas seymouri]